ncbi:D-alanyl-D-alanine carboxypeptidase family protein [Albidovulum sp.]|uniref:D-alanyl-D-alanine carboxypeptidase family protein n=1 Tax=Albidovulum sp. TaxID=1872424 RepID=UPI00352802A4
MLWLLSALVAMAAPYADFVIDARTGEVLHQENADTRLYPASLTKMMTLYIAFEAIERGEISLDSKVTISKHAAAQPPSHLGLKAGQTIALRYLIRAAAIKSANDAATAIGEAIEGSEPAFAKRMNRTAKALGMTKTTFVNANGLTASGHRSTARDMTTLGRHLFYDFPEYYGLFSRTTADAGVAKVASTNRRFLGSYRGADGIKTGYTSAAGFNLTASAQRGEERIIATILGGKSTAWRNERMADLLDLGFSKAPSHAVVQKPGRPVYKDQPGDFDDEVARVVATAVAGSRQLPAGKTIRLNVAVATSPRPRHRDGGTEPDTALPQEMLVAMQDTIDAVLAEAQAEPAVAEDTTEEPEDPSALAADDSGPDTSLGASDAAPLPAVETVADAASDAGGAAFRQTTAPQPETVAALAALGDGADAAADAGALVQVTAIAPASSVVPLAAPNRTLPGSEEAVLVAEADSNPKLLTVAEPAVADAAEETEETEEIVLASAAPPPAAPQALEVVTRASTSGGRGWAINVGRFNTRYDAERQLLQTALIEMNTLDEALRKVVPRASGYDANFVGMTKEMAELACRRLAARQTECQVVGP